MARQPNQDKREQLLAQASEILSRSGVVDTSLRSLAEQMGTTGRMLIYYFGSKEQLILDVLAREQRQFTPEPQLSGSLEDLRTYLLADWLKMTRGEKQTGVRILEQIFGAACAQSSPYAAYTTQTMEHLTNHLEGHLQAIGMPAHIASLRADLTVNAIQGFVIRYFTSTDPAMVDLKFQQMIDNVLLAPFQ